MISLNGKLIRICYLKVQEKRKCVGWYIKWKRACETLAKTSIIIGLLHGRIDIYINY